jgi:hypothetical protein
MELALLNAQYTVHAVARLSAVQNATAACKAERALAVGQSLLTQPCVLYCLHLCCTACAGEMSATMMRYTRDWASTIPDLRAMIGTTLAGEAAQGAAAAAAAAAVHRG